MIVISDIFTCSLPPKRIVHLGESINSIPLIEIFSEIKGFGHVKLRNFDNFENQYEQKIKEFKQSSKKIDLAAE